MTDLAAGVVVDGYEIEARLGRGGMGVVYAARDLELERQVAIKFLLGDSAVGLRRFQLEAVAAARVQHPGVVAVHAVGEHRGHPYIAMDHVDGVSLDRFLEEQDPSRRRRVELLAGVCQAVGAAHRRGVIHRDLKPANILVDRQGEPRVLDFGVAKLFAQGVEAAVRTREGELLGTPAYMAPEQVGGAGGVVDTRTDVFTLGVILYQLLTGELPFLRDSLAAMIHAVAYEEAEPMGRHGCDDADLQAVARAAMAKEPGERYQSVDALARDLRRWLAGEPVKARPRSATVLALRFLRGHYVATGVVLLLLLSLPAALGYRQWRRDEEVARLTAQGQARARLLAGHSARLEDQARLARTQAQDAAARRKLREAARSVEAETVAALSAFERALALDPAAPPARRALMEVLLVRAGLAERLHQDAVARMYVALARSRDPAGRWADRIHGRGAIDVGEDALDAKVTLRRFALDRRGVLVPVEPRELGNAPLGPVRLPTGSYLLTFRKPGHNLARVPVLVRRGRTAKVNPGLFRPDEIPAGYVHVPAGRFLMGDLRDTFGEGLAPWRELELPGFFIRRKPFTAGEVAAFLKTRPPGKRKLFTSYYHQKPLLRWEEKRGGVLWLPPYGEFGEKEPIGGNRWDITVVGLLTYATAKEMLRWEAGRIGRPAACVRMPSLAQYQKAGRGADGRAYPWGNTWIPGAAAVAEGKDQVYPVTAVPGVHPLDTSIYGVTDLVGNVTSWTSTPYGSRHGSVRGFHYVAGGAFSYFPRPLYVLSFYSEDESASEIGVRPVLDPRCKGK